MDPDAARRAWADWSVTDFAQDGGLIGGFHAPVYLIVWGLWEGKLGGLVAPGGRWYCYRGLGIIVVGSQPGMVPHLLPKE